MNATAATFAPSLDDVAEATRLSIQAAELTVEWSSDTLAEVRSNLGHIGLIRPSGQDWAAVAGAHVRVYPTREEAVSAALAGVLGW